MASLGITGKYLRQSIGATMSTQDDAINGFGLDLGFGLVLTDYARFGLVGGRTSRASSAELISVNTIPATLRAGLAVMPTEGLTVAFDMEKTRDDEDYCFHAGGEYALAVSEDFGTALRIGLNHDKFAGGLGLRYNFLTFDYAYVVEPEKFLGENHRFSVSLNFGRRTRMAPEGHGSRRRRHPRRRRSVPGPRRGLQWLPGLRRLPRGRSAEGRDASASAGGRGASAASAADPAFAYINFKFGTAEISGADPIPVLEDVARIMKERPDMKVRITGHTDNMGADDGEHDAVDAARRGDQDLPDQSRRGRRSAADRRQGREPAGRHE